MRERIIKWLIKKLVLLWDKHNDKLAFTFSRDEHTGYAILAERVCNDCHTFGTAVYPINQVLKETDT